MLGRHAQGQSMKKHHPHPAPQSPEAKKQEKELLRKKLTRWIVQNESRRRATSR
jgi:hypothetical protein